MSFLPSPSLGDAVYAALDLGTNNCRMLVARPVAEGFRVVDCFSRITRLGEGVAVSGMLAPAAMDRTVAALRACAEKMARNRVTRGRLVATEACRRAANHAEFARRVAGETGLVLDIISANEEAGLALAGCSSLMRPELPWALVFDIGGGSTELVWVKNDAMGIRVEGVLSLPVGVVTLAEERGEALQSPEGYASAVDDLAARMAPFEARHAIRQLMAEGSVQMLGTSGTVTTLAAMHLGLDRYDRAQVDGLDIGLDDIAAMNRRLTAMSLAARADHPCIGPDRADLVIGGCAILDAVCRLWPLASLRVADRGVREGVLLGLIRNDARLPIGAPV